MRNSAVCSTAIDRTSWCVGIRHIFFVGDFIGVFIRGDQITFNVFRDGNDSVFIRKLCENNTHCVPTLGRNLGDVRAYDLATGKDHKDLVLGVDDQRADQVAAIVIVLAFTQFVEPILRFGATIWEWTAQIGQFLPGAASDALVGASIFTTLGTGQVEAVSLEWWQGGLVLFAIASIAALAGYFGAWKRDVT